MFFRKKKKGDEEGRLGSERTAMPGPPASAPDASEVPPGTPPSTQFLTGEAGRDRRTVQVLLEAIARVSESRDLDALLVDIVDRSIEITGAERGLLLLTTPSGDLGVRVSRQRGGKGLADDARFSTTIASKVLKEIQALRATVHSESEALELGRSVYDLKLRAVMCVPLASGREIEGVRAPPSGVLYVDSRAATRQFSQGDLSLFAALAQHISIALENTRLHVDSLEKLRLEQSLELASAIQRDLMPKIPAQISGWDVHGWYGPADRTGGDFYDFVKAKDGRLGLLVGDATGHGIGPALITATAQASLRSFLRVMTDLGEVVTLLNQDLSERTEDGRFLTLYLALLSSDGSLEGLNAGHSIPFVWQKSTRSVLAIPRGGPALGFVPDERYLPHAPMLLAQGDVLAVYTDGLVEAREPEGEKRMFGEEGLRSALDELASLGLSAKEIAVGVLERAMRLSGNLREDDITLVVARRL